MHAPGRPIDPEDLLAHAGWVRSLARSLVADEHGADDVLQQTFVAAIEHPPGPGTPLAPWLARVARNFSFKLIRGRRRRSAREASAPPRTAPDGPDATLLRAETFRRVVDAVVALDPIYREVVLARYFDGLDVAEISARLGVPAETVRTRLRRALARLRERLDAEHDGRAAWVSLLAPPRPGSSSAASHATHAAGAAAVSAGGALMTQKVVAASVAVVLLVGGWLALSSSSRAPDAPAPDASDVAASGDWTRPSDAARPLAAVGGSRTDRPRSPRHPAPGPMAPGALPAASTVLVRVTAAESGAPLAGAHVSVSRTGGASSQVESTTDADGTARIGAIEPGRCSVAAYAAGRLPGGDAVDVADHGESRVDLSLVAAATLDVRCQDPAGATPSSVGFTWDVLGARGRGQGVAHRDQPCLVSVPPDCVVRLTANTIDFDHASIAVPTGPPGGAPVPVTLRVAPQGRLVGLVRDPDGRPVAGAKVQAMPSPGRADGNAAPPFEFDARRGGRQATSDAQGGFVVGGLVHGRTYDAVALATDGLAHSAPATGLRSAADAPDVTTEFTLRRRGAVVVRVTRPDGTPADDAVVGFHTGAGVTTVKPSAPGEFRLASLAPGPVTIVAGLFPSGLCALDVDVPAGATREVPVTLTTSPETTGVVVDEAGRPVPGATLTVRLDARHLPGLRVNLAATADSAGCFRIRLPRPGTYTADVVAPGFLATHVDALAASDDEVRVVLRHAATLALRVLVPDAAWRNPPGPIQVFLGDDTANANTSQEPYGSMRFDCAPRGATHARIHVQGYVPVIRPVTLTAGIVEDLGDVFLARPGKLRGRVVDAEGRPVALAVVGHDVGEETAGAADARRCVTDGRGEFTADLAPPAGQSVPLRVSADGYLTLRTVVTPDGDAPVTLTLARGGLVWGEVVDAHGEPVPNGVLRVVDSRGTCSDVVADDSGVFGRRVAAGRCGVSSAGGAATADVPDGGESHVRVVVPAR